MAEVKMRLNLDTEEVELVVDGQVALASGSDVFKNWVDAYNTKHKPVEPEVVVTPDEPVEDKVVPTAEEVTEPVTETPAVEVDTTEKE